MLFKTLIAMENEEANSIAEATVPEEVTTAVMDDRRMVEADVASDDIENVTRALSSLDEVADVVSQAYDEGGMSDTTAAAVGVGLEHIYSSLGAYRNHLNLSLESFKDDPKQATQIVLESIGDRIESIWKNLMEMIKRFIRWIADFFGDLTSSVEGLARRAEKNVDLLKAIKGKPAKYEIEDEALQRRLYSANVDANKLPGAFQDMGETVFNAQFGLNQIAATEAASLINLMTSTMKRKVINTGTEDIDSLKKKTMALVGKLGTDLFTGMQGSQEGVPQAPVTVDVYSTPTMIGGKGYYAFVPKDWEHIDDLKLGIYQGEDGNYNSIPVLTTIEMKQVASTVIAMRRVKQLNKQTLAQLRSLETMLGFIASTVGKGTGSHQYAPGYTGEIAQARTKITRAVLKIFTSKGMSGFGHYVAAGRDMLRLMEMSMRQYPEIKMSESRELVLA